MISYRFKRRAFLAGIGGGVGLKVMLRNVEAVAQGATRSPARLARCARRSSTRASTFNGWPARRSSLRARSTSNSSNERTCLVMGPGSPVYHDRRTR